MINSLQCFVEIILNTAGINILICPKFGGMMTILKVRRVFQVEIIEKDTPYSLVLPVIASI